MWWRSVFCKGVKCFVSGRFGGRLKCDVSVGRQIVANLTSVRGLYREGQQTNGTAEFSTWVMRVLFCAKIFTII